MYKRTYASLQAARKIPSRQFAVFFLRTPNLDSQSGQRMIGRLKQYDEISDIGYIVVTGGPARPAFTFKKKIGPTRWGWQ